MLDVVLRLVELALEAGIPKGVLNVVHGGEAVVNGICDHPEIKAVSFVGSTKVGTHVFLTKMPEEHPLQRALAKQPQDRFLISAVFLLALQGATARIVVQAAPVPAFRLAEAFDLDAPDDILTVLRSSRPTRARPGPWPCCHA